MARREPQASPSSTPLEPLVRHDLLTAISQPLHDMHSLLKPSQSAVLYTFPLTWPRWQASFWLPGRVQAGLCPVSGAPETRGAWCCAGGIIGPYLIGALSDKYSYGAAMITLGAFNLLAAVLFTTFPGKAPTSEHGPLHAC